VQPFSKQFLVLKNWRQEKLKSAGDLFWGVEGKKKKVIYLNWVSEHTQKFIKQEATGLRVPVPLQNCVFGINCVKCGTRSFVRTVFCFRKENLQKNVY
jgi:hypothetical protein